MSEHTLPVYRSQRDLIPRDEMLCSHCGANWTRADRDLWMAQHETDVCHVCGIGEITIIPARAKASR